MTAPIEALLKYMRERPDSPGDSLVLIVEPFPTGPRFSAARGATFAAVAEVDGCNANDSAERLLEQLQALETREAASGEVCGSDYAVERSLRLIEKSEGGDRG